MKIILDAMGGDNAPQAVVQGALEAHAQCGADIVLVGREEDIRACLTGPLPEGVEIVNATEVVDMCDDPATAFKRKKDSSDRGPDHAEKRGGRCLRLRRLHRRAAGGGTLLVKRIRGVRRAAWGLYSPPPLAMPFSATAAPTPTAPRSTCCNSPIWQLLRPAAHGGGEAPGGPAEHRCRAVQGRYPPP